ncbi:MAG TPA: TetR/AcrR family transcriptional regulator [Acidimicrobiales bacterium]|nr:TetR/AcrR family transcriptional regulator [Acidimicrobiales bacterium]
MGAPRRMSRESRRTSLLESAAALVEQGGVGAVTFEAVAEAAGVAKTLPYAYFESREEILLALFDRVIGGIDADVASVLGQEQAFEEVVRQSLDVWFDAVRDHGRLVGGLLDGRSEGGLAAAIRRRDRRSHKLWHDLVADRFQLTDRHADVLAAMLTTTATAVVDLWVRRKGSQDSLVSAFVAMATGAAEGLRRSG